MMNYLWSGNDFTWGIVGGSWRQAGRGNDGSAGRGRRSSFPGDNDAGGDGFLERDTGDSTKFRAGGLDE